MAATRREVMWRLGLAVAGAAARPSGAWADRIRILEAGPPSLAGGERSLEVERRVAALTPGDTRQRGALAVVWLLPASAPGALDVATLDEAHAAGLLVVTERDRASVPDLVVDNQGQRPVLLLAGEILLGGKQHRVLAEDVLLPPRSGPRNIGVYCVEAGRWSGPSARFETKGTFAPSRLRSEVLAQADQQRVWGAVSAYAARAAAPSPTQSYDAVVEQREVKEHVRQVQGDLARPPAGAIGAAAFAGTRLAGLDVFQTASLFGRLWPKLLRAHAVETYRAAEGPDAPGAPPVRLRAILAAVLHARGTSRRNVGEGRLFEFRADGRRGAALVHRDEVLHLAVL